NPSLEAVVSLKPDLVVSTTDGNPKEFVERLRSLNIKTFVFTARRLRELPQGIRELGEAVGVRGKADALAYEIEKALKGYQESGASQKRKNSELGTPNSGLNKTKVLFIVWPEPLIVAGPGTAMDDAIALLGYENIAHGAATAYPKYSIEEVLRRAPDVLFIGKATGMDMRAVSQGFLKRLSLVPAVRNNKICYVSDNLYRLAPRVVRGIEELAECLK
ncbi:MAG: helical backbone metal receptor, partial [Nitrospirota bacterium]